MTEMKLTIPTNIMWVLIGSILFQSATSLLLIRQRYYNDKEFMVKVEEIRNENSEMRAQLSK